MQYADNAPFAAAVTAPVRQPAWRVLVDWNGDGLFNHPLSNLSRYVDDIDVDRALSGGVEAGASLVSGAAGASCTVTLSGTVLGMSLASAISPYNPDALLTGQTLGRLARVELGFVTADGTATLPQITGPVRSLDLKSGKVILTVADPSDTLRAPITLPYASIHPTPRLTRKQYPYGIRTQWVIDYILRRNGYGAKLHANTVFSATLHGAHVAEVGESVAPSIVKPTPVLAAAEDWWVEGPHGFVAPRGSWLTPVAFDTACRDMQIRTTPSGVGVSCWAYFGTDHQPTTGTVTDTISLVRVQFGPDATNDRIGLRLLANGQVHGYAGNRAVSMAALQAEEGNPIGWHYIAVHVAFPAPGSPITVTVRYDNYWGVATPAAPVFSPTLWPFTTAIVFHGVPMSDASVWTSPTPPSSAAEDWPGLAYDGDDHGQIDLGVNYLSWLPERTGKDSWDLLQEVAGAEAGAVGFDELGRPFFLDRNTLTAGTGTIEKTVTSSRELLSLDVGLSSDTVRNVAEVETVAAHQEYTAVAFEAVTADQFDTPANSTRDYSVWCNPFILPGTVEEQFVPFLTQAQYTDANIGKLYAVAFAAVRVDNNAELTAGIDVSWVTLGPRRIRIRVKNNHGFAVRLATTGGQPALKVAGFPIVKENPVVTRIERITSIGQYGERTLDLGGSDWDQDPDTRALLAWDLLDELRRPVPVVPDVDAVGDPRVQLTDTLDIRDPGRVGASIPASVVTLKRTLSAEDGIRDTYGVRPVLAPDGVDDGDPPVTPDPDGPVDPGDPGDPGGRAYFGDADWHWDPIPASPVLDSNNAAIVNLLKAGGHVLNCVRYGNTLRGPGGITSGTPRYTVAAEYAAEWGPAFPSGATIPIPNGTENFIPPGEGPGEADGHVAIADPTTNKVYSLWIAEKNGGTWSCGWGGTADLDGDGRESIGGSTGAGISRYACVIRVAELQAGVIPHALFFSTDIVRGPNGGSNFKYPATKTDGQNMAGVPDASAIWEGTRVQLDPSLNPDAYGLNTAERAIFVALQTYGAYCGDNGGTRMAFLSELADDWGGNEDNPGAKYAAAGITSDYYSLSKIPWASLRVLRNWDGSA